MRAGYADMIGRRIVPLLAGCVAVAAPAQTSVFETLRGLDVRVATAAERLTVANAALCRRVQPGFGLVLHAIDQYPPTIRAQVRGAFGFAVPVAVELVVPGGPAAQAGIRADDGLVAIAGVQVAAEAAPDALAASADTRDRIAARLAALPVAPVVLTIVRGGVPQAVRVSPRPACASQVEVATDRGSNAGADGETIQVGAGLVERVDEVGLALVLAHELAHNILEHRRRLATAGVRGGIVGEFGRNRRLTRIAEDQADRLSAVLLYNAGYDVAAAAGFWRTQGAALDGGVFRSRTHSGAASRARILEAEQALLAAQPARPVRPDWIDGRDGGLE